MEMDDEKKDDKKKAPLLVEQKKGFARKTIQAPRDNLWLEIKEEI